MWNRGPKGKIFVVSGPSGSGKSTLLKAVQAKKEFRGDLAKIVTVTTRAPRRLEAQGKDYYFVSREQFLRLRQRAGLPSLKRSLGNITARPKRIYCGLLTAEKTPFYALMSRGLWPCGGFFPKEAIFIFISVVDMRSLRQRLSLRSTESGRSLNTRLKIAKEELNCQKYYDYVIINDVLRRAVSKLAAVITAERLRQTKERG